jgi:hypothetical protein
VSTASDDQVRQRVRQLLESGDLPRGYPAKLWVAPATRQPCCCCGESIKTGYEYELSFTKTPSLKFHPRCYVIWDEEQAALSEGPEPPPPPGRGT